MDGLSSNVSAPDKYQLEIIKDTVANNYPIGYCNEMRKSKVGEVILLALEKAADGYLALDYFARSGNSVLYGYEPPKSNIRNAVYRLNKRGYIAKSVNEGKIVLKLMEPGRDWVVKYSEPDKWDGVWRIVIYDIPEKHRNVRWVLRNKLKVWGFSQWQKSVWASKKPLTDALRKLVSDLKVQDWVLILESTNTGRHK